MGSNYKCLHTHNGRKYATTENYSENFIRKITTTKISEKVANMIFGRTAHMSRTIEIEPKSTRYEFLDDNDLRSASISTQGNHPRNQTSAETKVLFWSLRF